VVNVKKKGCDAERELVHMFWATDDWSACRIAGSGSSRYPSPDLLASNGLRKLAVECKSIKGNKKYFDDSEIEQLVEFSNKFGAEAWLALKFNNKGWHFISIEELSKTGKGYVISFSDLGIKGLSFEDLTHFNV